MHHSHREVRHIRRLYRSGGLLSPGQFLDPLGYVKIQHIQGDTSGRRVVGFSPDTFHHAQRESPIAPLLVLQGVLPARGRRENDRAVFCTGQLVDHGADHIQPAPLHLAHQVAGVAGIHEYQYFARNAGYR